VGKKGGGGVALELLVRRGKRRKGIERVLEEDERKLRG
jgi:hypothetical protein